jgi:frataxin-like iron-binding protein CyaY
MANREDDSDSDAEIEDGVAGLTIDNDGDDMLSINSAMVRINMV